ncbi:flavin-containing amine protein [Pochonia chlamydosporia 170]|uniref:monoamine oxidase n=1 Tax=Pochonia chlamydosporia 170 TaxID=1380566 RepID=A0A219ARF5_METCM|nr:flavin-containing amine protein [Pochonia chlamydosporia 170]OWT42914.1 flavin-containing amine protein [Pochonia chlamydosporia 170]
MTPGSILLSSPVASVRQIGGTRGEVVVTTRNNLTFRAKKTIISVPTPLYRDITFNPPLSGAKLELSNNTRLGYFSKVILVYAKPWWKEAGLAGLAHSLNTTVNLGGSEPDTAAASNGAGPITLIRDTSHPEDGVYALTCFVVANTGRAWSQLPAAQRRSEILSQVASIYKDIDRDVVYSPVEIFEQQEWSKEEWSKGCPCPVAGPGVLSTVGHAIREPFGNVHFVGTETSVVWKGYMEGAVRSGERGATEVVEALRKAATPTANL